jgi:hypothetical protein
VKISSRRVTAIPSLGDAFPWRSELRFFEELRATTMAILERRGVRGEPALAIARRAVTAGSAFFEGDEPGPAAPVDRSMLGLWSGLAEAAIRGFLDALSTDLEPADNDLMLAVE